MSEKAAAATEKWDDKKNIRNVLRIFLMPLNKDALSPVSHRVEWELWVDEKRFGGLSVPRKCLLKINSIPQMVYTFKRNYP